MAKFRLVDWEQNQYHDSYFYLIHFDNETNEIGQTMIGSTAFGGGNPIGGGDDFQNPTVEIVEAAIKVQAEKNYRILKREDEREIAEPETMRRGDELVFNAPAKFNDKRTGEKVTADAGDKCRVFFEPQHYGTFYRNGYNKRGRSNGRVGVELNKNGKRMFVSMEKLSLCRAPASEEIIREMALRNARCLDFGNYPWATKNFAKECMINAGLASYQYGHFTWTASKVAA